MASNITAWEHAPIRWSVRGTIGNHKCDAALLCPVASYAGAITTSFTLVRTTSRRTAPTGSNYRRVCRQRILSERTSAGPLRRPRTTSR